MLDIEYDVNGKHYTSSFSGSSQETGSVYEIKVKPDDPSDPVRRNDGTMLLLIFLIIGGTMLAGAYFAMGKKK